MTEREKEIVNRLAELAKRPHHYCDDSWYSCPKHPEGCSNDNMGTNCNCGADRINTEVDVLMKKLNDCGENAKQRRCGMTDAGIRSDGICSCIRGYSLEVEDDGRATLYLGRCDHCHGYNLGRIDEPDIARLRVLVAAVAEEYIEKWRNLAKDAAGFVALCAALDKNEEDRKVAVEWYERYDDVSKKDECDPKREVTDHIGDANEMIKEVQSCCLLCHNKRGCEHRCTVDLRQRKPCKEKDSCAECPKFQPAGMEGGGK